LSPISFDVRDRGPGSSGNSAPTSRIIVARVTGNVAVGVNFFTGPADNIKAALANNGWSINSVSMDTSLWFPGGSASFTVSANVENQYSDNDVIANLISQISASGTLSNVAASLVSTNPTYNPGGGSSPSPTPSPSPSPSPTPGAPPAAPAATDWTAALAPFAFGGLSGVVVVGGIVMILALRSKS
jgi:hypothetical protein